MKVTRGEIFGNTANAVSPTRPLVTLLTAPALTGRLRYGAAVLMSALSCTSANLIGLTVDQHTIAKRVHGPSIWRPVRVAQPSRKGKEPAENLWYLTIVDERPECKAGYESNADAQLDAVPESDVEDRAWPKTVSAE